ncbi:MAG: ABC transporter substrate-binding protein [Corticimicrobacter sp.]|uniref:ABC transporter substrate-binding protein n=1 Tax=Corticimicrobacter sp. TaxID=2678536 RepID=UPI0032D9B68C
MQRDTLVEGQVAAPRTVVAIAHGRRCPAWLSGRRLAGLAAACMLALGLDAAEPVRAADAPNELRVIAHSNITMLDPIWTTAYLTRNFGYMVYDTLFGTDAEGRIQPQMVQDWTVSADGLTWTFTLREGLKFHDGEPVTSADVIMSLRRWASRDTLGGLLEQSLDHYDILDDRTFQLVLAQPFGMVLEALGKPSSNVPFIMPERVARTPGDQQIREAIGSGPYRFVESEFRPGESVLFVRNEDYVPRDEPPSGTAGGKQVYVDQVRWLIIRDPQTQLNALLNGEADILEQPAFEQYPVLAADPDIEIVNAQPAGLQYSMRFNFKHPPFDNPEIRRAAMLALGQEQFLKTQVGIADYYRFCTSMFPCGTPFASEQTGGYTGRADPAAARALLEKAGYQGEPVVLLQPTDLSHINKLPLVARQQLERAGFKVDLQSMDWQTLVSRRARQDAPAQGGWNLFLTAWVAEDILNPLTMAMMNARGDQGWFGWQDDPELERIKREFARATTDADKKQWAERAQLRAFETASHVPLGQYIVPPAVRKGVTGIVPAGAQVYWNIRKDPQGE